MIHIIVAMDENNLIGKKASSNGIPWKNKEDLQHFKKTTLNQNILMGYTTYQAICRPLPNRHTIVVSDQPFEDERVEVRTSLDEVLKEYQGNDRHLYISGGASIYQQTLAYADELLISRIPGTFEGETYFPSFDAYDYQLVETIPYETFQLEVYRRGAL